MTLGDYLLGQWLPAKEATLAPSTHARNVTCIEHYLLPHLGDIPLRRLRPSTSSRSTDDSCSPAAGTVGRWPRRRSTTSTRLIRAALRRRRERRAAARESRRAVPTRRTRARGRRAVGGPGRGPRTELADVPRRRPPRIGHAMLFRLAAATGMRRGEVLGLRWDDVHFDTGRIEVTQALISIGYRLEFSRLKTRTSRRNVTVDADTHGHARRLATHAKPRRARRGRRRQRARARVHPPRRQAAPPSHGVPGLRTRAADCSTCRRSGSTTSATPTPASCYATRVPIKVVSERLGHSNPAFTMTTYQHVLPGMQEDAAATFGQLLANHSPKSATKPGAA